MTNRSNKGGFIGLLANLGLVEETPDPVHPPMAAHPPEARLPAAPAAHGAASPNDAVDPEVLSKLELRLQKNCPLAYTGFIEQFDNLKDVVPDESMRFRAALKASHTTTDQLVDALGQLIGAMAAAATEFTHAFEENKRKKLGEAEASLKATDEQIASYERQLESAQGTIASLRTKRETDAQAMHDDALKIDGVRASFEAAHARVVARLEAQKSRVLAMQKV